MLRLVDTVALYAAKFAYARRSTATRRTHAVHSRPELYCCLMGSEERARLLRDAVRAIASRCPRLIAECYWAGTSAIALEELGHRESFDLDFHSRHAFVDTRPFLAELQRAFPGALELNPGTGCPGSGFLGSHAG